MQVSILFEVEDLSQASPATVSRAGMVYLNVEDLGWQPYIASWLQKKQVRYSFAATVRACEQKTLTLQQRANINFLQVACLPCTSLSQTGAS